MGSVAPPTKFGERLLPSVVDEIAVTDPARVLYSITKGKSPVDGFQDITAVEFARAVDRCAWHLEDSLGGRGENFPTLLYMGAQDLVYAILVLASNKAGYKVLLSSPRNTLEAHLSLLEQTECNVFLQPPVFPLPVVKQIENERPMKVVIIPGGQHWLGEGEHKPYPYTKTFEEASMDPFVVLHTSGSTGLPKPVIQRNATQTPLDAFNTLPSQGLPASYPAMCAGKRVYLAFPLFHCAGISMLLPAAIYNACTVVLGPFPPSADVADAIHVHGNVQQSCLAPMTLVDLVKDPQHLENLSRLELITFGGGPCPKPVGDLISTKTKLLNVLGTTECGVLPSVLGKPENWEYISQSPRLGQEYREVSEGLYEQTIVRKPELSQYQGIFATFPDLQEYPMKDLYTKHPTEENVWLYKGRSDDIIVMSTGEKFNPIDFENTVNANPAVSAVLVAGLGRFQTSLLVEAAKPPTNESEEKELLDEIWPSIEGANKQSPSHAQLHRELVVFTKPDRPMLRAGKGTVQRKMTIELYQKELDALYESIEKETVDSGAVIAGDGGESSLRTATKSIVLGAIKLDSSVVPDEADLFELGLDSLQVTSITRQINKLLVQVGQPPSFNIRDVYANANINSLSSAVVAFSQGKKIKSEPKDALSSISELISTHSSNLPISGRSPLKRPSDKSVVLLTGATGSLGAYVLDALLKNPRVERIYTLNRGADGLSRLQNSLSAKGLPAATDRVISIEATLSEPYFGLAVEQYKKLLGEVTDVVHNAWKVDFNQAIDSFATHVSSVRRVIDFSAHSAYGAKITFISSVSAVSGLGKNASEQIHEDRAAPGITGYGQSKYISEVVLDVAAKQASTPAEILRVGQVAGPLGQAGIWPKQEWLPSLVASSKYLGILPDSLGRMQTIDWIPVDVLGQAIAEIVLNSSEDSNASGAKVYHLANSKHTDWSTLLPAIAKGLGAGIKVVPLADWVKALHESEDKTEDADKNPAVKLLDFFNDLARSGASEVALQTKNALEASKTLAELGPVQESWVENWLKQWNF